VGKRRFRDLFKERFDMTPSRYLTFKKTTLAEELLSAGGISVAEAAARSGFSDVYYFSKVFKEFSGVTPGRWK